MSIRAAAITASLFTALASGVLLAQQADPADSEDGAATVTTAGTETESGQTSGRDETAPAGDSDPFDYESSEQISEDLSVSFPVDI